MDTTKNISAKIPRESAGFKVTQSENFGLEQKTSGRGVYVPLAFLPGEAFQFDWSEDWAIISGERTKLQVAHFKLSYSRAWLETRCQELWA